MHIQLEPIPPGKEITSVDLREPGEAGSYLQDGIVFVLVLIDSGLQHGAWTNDTHITDEYIVKLRKLVETPSTGKDANPRISRIVCRRIWAGADIRRVVDHSSQLVDRECRTTSTNPRLSKDHRAGSFKPRKRTNCENQRDSEGRHSHRDGNVKRPLECCPQVKLGSDAKS